MEVGGNLLQEELKEGAVDGSREALARRGVQDALQAPGGESGDARSAMTFILSPDPTVYPARWAWRTRSWWVSVWRK